MLIFSPISVIIQIEKFQLNSRLMEKSVNFLVLKQMTAIFPSFLDKKIELSRIRVIVIVLFATFFYYQIERLEF